MGRDGLRHVILASFAGREGGGLNTPMTRVPTGVFFGGVRDRPPAGVWCPRYHC